MPLLETEASEETACISTATRFTQRDTGKAKAHSDSWWALMVHDDTGRPCPTLLWALLIGAGIVADAVVPRTADWMPCYDAFVVLTFALTGLIPNDGTTVLPYYVHVGIPQVRTPECVPLHAAGNTTTRLDRCAPSHADGASNSTERVGGKDAAM